MKRLLLALLLLTAAGCAGLKPDPDGWEPTPRMRPLAPMWHTVSREELRAICRYPQAYACVQRDYSTGLCWIIADLPEHRMPAWAVEHEKKHCAGYEHPYEDITKRQVWFPR